MSATILYLDTIPGNRIQETTLAGMRRYAVARGWDVEAVPWDRSRPEALPALLARHRPVGCVVECADGRSDLPPRLFGGVPAVYLHGVPGLYGLKARQLNTDNAAIASAAFRELSAGRPAAYALVGFRAAFAWSEARERAFADIARASGKPFFRFRRIGGRDNRRDENREERMSRFLSRLPPHTAVFAANDATAAEVAQAARAAGQLIPRDMTLLGVDNNESICAACVPPLSSIQVDFERTGFLVARMIGDVLAEKNAKGRRDFANAASFAPKRGSATIGPLLAVRRESTRGFGRREPQILRAVEMIRLEASEGLSAGALAARFPGSRRLFELRFREARGHSVLDEILHVRLEKVFTLLARTDTPIGAIAALCGFGSDIALRQLFVSRTGMSMREWRRRNRK